MELIPALRRQETPPDEGAGRPGTASAGPEPRAGGPDGGAPPRPRRRGRLILAAVVLAALGLGAWQGVAWWTVGRFEVSTDDAYVQVDMAVLAPKIAGYVAAVLVEENDRVRAGDPVVRLDDGDLKLALDAARAKLETQTATVDRIGAQIEAAHRLVVKAEAGREAARARLAEAEASFKRKTALVAGRVSSPAELDTATAERDAARADFAGAEAAVSSAEADVAVLEAERTEARQTLGELEVQRRMAERDLGFATIRAPFDGTVGNRQVQVGDYVTPGRKLAAIAPLDRVYVEANFKETDLAGIVPGERATITVDALPGREIAGTVSSISPASGAVFSLLPPENATGNFTKIVQRLPVRIDVPADVAAEGVLRPGLSVVVTIDTRTAPAAPSAGEAR